MDRKNKILICISVILVLVVTYFIINNSFMKNGVLSDEIKSQASAMKEDFMKAHVPSDLTDEQKAELKSGFEDHKPMNLTFNITGGSFYFAPNEIRVKEGDKVKIVFTNNGGLHNLILEAFNVQTKTINTGESDSFEFTANKKGTFEFYCGVGKGYHRMKGQIGVLIVQ